MAISELSPIVGVKASCESLGESRARYYLKTPQVSSTSPESDQERGSTRALDTLERIHLRHVLLSEEHVDEARTTVYTKLLDEGST